MENKHIDRLVHISVLGHPENTEIPNYSTDISYAWKVVERFDDAEINTKLNLCRLWSGYRYKEVRNVESVPMAICLASLALKKIKLT